MTDVTAAIREFVREDVRPYLSKEEGAEDKFPRELVDKMAQMGLFGLNVPDRYAGGGLAQPAVLSANRELSAGWQSLSALLGTHFRVCLYLTRCGTEEQRERLLPQLATGRLLVSHAYHEKSIRDHARFRTTISMSPDERPVLSGVKHWVTNARDADLIVVIARCGRGFERHGTVAVLVHPDQLGVEISGDLTRPGVKGVSLSSVKFNDCELDPDECFVGGLKADIDGFIDRFESGSSLGFCARALGSAEAAVRDLDEFRIDRGELGSGGQEVTAYRYGGIRTTLYSMQATFAHAAQALGEEGTHDSVAHMAKVYCSDSLQAIVRDCIMLKGGDGYAAATNELSRIYRDAISLMLIDTPNDILLTTIGRSLPSL
jgi:alkylation response protein AidB-like acyl-CoA dehydrogenase